MTLAYAFTPFIAWFCAGTLKFIVNALRERRLAYELIGYGGAPSNHSAIVSSIAALIYFKEGFDHPSFGLALALAFVVILDASSLRRQVGRHAAIINRLSENISDFRSLRERIGHSPVEIALGVVLGGLVGYVMKSA